jgi:hypothetical protein
VADDGKGAPTVCFKGDIAGGGGGGEIFHKKGREAVVQPTAFS